MKKTKYQRERKKYFFKKNLLFPILLSFSFLFLCIGYASINDIGLNINGIANAEAQDGVFISDIQLLNNEEKSETGDALNYYGTMLNTNVVLSKEKDSEISFEISLYNNSNIIYIYDAATPNEYDEDFFPNKYITYEIDNRLVQGEKIESYQTHKFTITFKYIDELDFNDLPEDFSNVLNSWINFKFAMLQHIELGENIFDLSTVISNSYIGTDGALIDYDKWSSSDYIDISDYENVIIVADSNSILNDWNAVYDENYNFIQRLNVDQEKVKNSELGNLYLGLNIIKVEEGFKYMRISAETSVLNGAKVYPILNNDFNRVLNYNLIDYRLSFGDNIYDFSNNTLNSYINKANGSLISYNGWQSSEYIDVSNYKRIAITSDSTNSLSSWNAFYDHDKNFVKSLDCSSLTKKYDKEYGYYKLVDITTNYHYLRISEVDSIMNNIKIYPVIESDYEENNLQNLKVGENIYKLEENVANSYIDKSTGNEISYNGWSSSNYMYVGDYDDWIIVGGYNFLSDWNALYDENKNFVKSFTCSNTELYNKVLGNQKANMCIYTKEPNVKYIRVSESNYIMNDIRVYPVINNDFNGVISFDITNN